jgi:hypothetical protein
MESPYFLPNGPQYPPRMRQPLTDTDNTPFMDSFDDSSEFDSGFEVMDVLLKQLFQPIMPQKPFSKSQPNHIHFHKSENLNISTLKSGDKFGPFLVQNYIGHGGFGVVFRATDTRNDHQVALKIPRSDRTTDQKTFAC